MGRRIYAVVGDISTEVLRMVSMLWMLTGIEYRGDVVAVVSMEMLLLCVVGI
jgi:hypothetical protein